MKIDFSYQPTDMLTKKPIFDPELERDIRLSDIAVKALTAQTQEDAKEQTADEKVKCYRIGAKIVDSGIVDVSAEEIALMKTRIGKLFGPAIVGQCFDALERVVPENVAQLNAAAKEVANG